MKLKFYHLVSFTHFKSHFKNQDHVTYNGKVICTFVILLHKPRLQTETWKRAIEDSAKACTTQS